jgi:hypothetical protein
MKKLILLVVILITLAGCTDNAKARRWGGTEIIQLPPGQKLVTATWKEADLWYVTEPMDPDYVAKTKTFKEKSQFGYMEGTIQFVESR